MLWLPRRYQNRGTIDAVPSIWTPASEGANLFGWWKASAGVNLSGSTLTSWNDQSGNGNTLTPHGGGWTFSATGFNGNKPGLSLHSGTDWLDRTNFSFNQSVCAFFMTLKPDISNFAAGVCRQFSFTANAQVDYSGANSFNSAGSGNGTLPNGYYIYTFENNATFSACATGNAGSVAQTLALVFDGSNITQYYQGGTPSVGAPPFVGPVGNGINNVFRIAADTAGAGQGYMDLAEICVFKNNPSVASYQSYASATWGV